MALPGRGVDSSGRAWAMLPISGDRLSGGKSLPKFLTPPAVNVFHFPEFLGYFSKDDSSVLFALSQGLHVSQEFFPLLDFLHHWTEERAVRLL